MRLGVPEAAGCPSYPSMNDRGYVGIAIGIAIGVTIGVALDNIGMGIGIGLALAIAMGLVFRKSSGGG